MTFGAHKLFIPRRFSTTYMNFDNLLSAPYSDMRKNYIGALVHIYISTFSALNTAVEIFQISRLFIWSRAHKLFAIFNRIFANIVTRSSDENEKNENCVVHMKTNIFLKKNAGNRIKNYP